MQTLFSRRPRTPLVLLFAIVWLLIPLQAAHALDFGLGALEGSGEVQREARTVEPFRGLRLQTLARVVIRPGERDAVEVLAEGNVLPLIGTRVEHGTLVVEDSKRFKSSTAEVTITVRQIESLDGGGATAVVAEGLRGPALSISLGGVCALTLKDVSVDRLHASLGGASALKMSGSASDVSIDLGGTAAVQAAGLEAKRVSVSGGGTAQALVWATQSLSISVSGAAGVRYYGVSNASVQVGGVAQVRRLGAMPPRPM
ncbi:MAG TPA: head GIN domain-containing protein [Burkholderiaceae bacterium]|nr:head GIN domain-containing protein [Burkholderiaceae bacterium]